MSSWDAMYIPVVNIFLSISVILTYPLQFRPAAAVIEKKFGILATLPGAAVSDRGRSLQARVDHIPPGGNAVRHLHCWVAG